MGMPSRIAVGFFLPHHEKMSKMPPFPYRPLKLKSTPLLQDTPKWRQAVFNMTIFLLFEHCFLLVPTKDNWIKSGVQQLAISLKIFLLLLITTWEEKVKMKKLWQLSANIWKSLLMQKRQHLLKMVSGLWKKMLKQQWRIFIQHIMYPTEYISDRPKQALLIEISFLVCLLFKAGYVTE